MPQIEAEQLSLFDVGPDISQIRLEADAMKHYNRARSTVACYTSDWKKFENWCASAGRKALPCTGETLDLYLMVQLRRGRKVAGVQRVLSAILAKHKDERQPRPDTKAARATLVGCRRRRKEAPNQRAPLMLPELRAICHKLCHKQLAIRDAEAVRDRALLLLGLATGLRASNLAGLDVGDLRFVDGKGVVVSVRSSKTDQVGKGRIIGVKPGDHPETDPVVALQDWLALRNKVPGVTPKKGPLFIRTRAGWQVETPRPINKETVNQTVKKWVAKIGLDPARYGGHSLRAGFVTVSHLGGASDLTIIERTGHKSFDTLRPYFRNADPFAGPNPLANAL